MNTTSDKRAAAPQGRDAHPPARLARGATLNDRYQIDDHVGTAPYAEVYRGRDLADGKLVTLKVLFPALLADAQTREELEREVQVAVQLEHKNIGATYGLFGATIGAEPVAYLVTEYVDGQSLREMIDKKRAAGRTFSLKGTYNVVAHICNGLTYAHGATFHGGLSPESVLVNSAGRVKLVDFGLARVLRPLDHLEVRAGSLASLAPEVVASPEAADRRADIYSLGVILFELLAGRPPSESFERPSVVNPTVPKAVDQVLERCLKPLPQERYPDAQSVKEALHAALAGQVDEPSIPGRTPTIAPVSANEGKPMSAQRPTDPPRPPAGKAPPTPPKPPAKAAPGPPAPGRISQPPAIAHSFNVDAALSAVDDTTERWLIQKDRLDFGPFSMRDVRSQIESGKILGEHTIMDTESGERRKVKDHPQLRQLVLEAEARLSEKARLDAEAADRRRARNRVIMLLGVILVVVLGVGGGVTWYVLNMKPEKVVVHDKADDLDWLKDPQITLKVDPPPAKKSGKRPKSGKPGEFSDVTHLGDASEEGGDETLDQNVVQRVMTQNYKTLVGCIIDARRKDGSLRNVEIDFIVKGSGNVSAVKVNGQQTSPLSGCIFAKMQTFSFPKFNGAKTRATFSIALR